MIRPFLERYGWRVQVETETHGTFWVNADDVTVLGDEE